MKERLARALHIVQPEPLDQPRPNPELEQRVEAVVAKVDSLEARVSLLEEEANPVHEGQ
jgi:hypothetical protein